MSCPLAAIIVALEPSYASCSNLLTDTGLDDLCVRFIVNLPASELKGFDRIGTHIEEAHWFYEDFIRQLDPSLPSMNLRNFSQRIFQRFPLTADLRPDFHEKAYSQWIEYKKRIPVRGAILLNEALDSVLLVHGQNRGSAWMFPRGKINEGEDDLDCAIREVYEETGFNARDAGLIPENRALKCFDMTLREQNIKLFVIPNVPMDTHFEPRTRGEIGGIQWFKLADLPGRSKKKQGQEHGAAGAPNANKFYNIASFLEQLNRWIKHQTKRRDGSRHVHKPLPLGQMETEDGLTEEEKMTTQTAAEPPPVHPTTETHEAATRELHRLLNIQERAQRSKEEFPSSTKDKGQAILAMLHQSKDASPCVREANYSNSRMPHTPMENVYNVAPEPHTPHHHHPTQRLLQDGYQASPAFPAQPDMNKQLRSVLGLTGNAPAQSTQQTTQIITQHTTVANAPESATRPNLLHPQPLPRQANYILTDAAMPMAPSLNSNHVPGAQQTNLHSPFVSGNQLPHQLLSNLGQPSKPLDNARLALLNAFKTESGLVQDTAIKVAQHQTPMAETYRASPQQPINPATLGSPYGLGAATAYPGLGESHGNVLATQINPQASASFRPHNISQNQQKALLDIFKQPTATPPSFAPLQSDFKENSVPQQVSAQHLMQIGVGTIQPTSQDQPVSQPYGTRTLAIRANPSENIAFGQFDQKQALQSSSHSLDGRAGSVGNKPQAAHGSSRDLLLGSPYTNPAKFNPAASPGSLSSIPNLIPRHQDADPLQVQRLMSLFGKPAAVPSDATVSNFSGKGKEPAVYDARIPQTGTNIAPMATTPGLDGTGSAHNMSRRGSQQTPISPENEKFLLNYLKTVSSGAK